MGIVQLVEVPDSHEGSLGIALPNDVLTRLKLSEGDTLLLAETPDGLRLTLAPATPNDTPPHTASER